MSTKSHFIDWAALFIIIMLFFYRAFFIDSGFIGGIDVRGYFYWNEAFLRNNILSGHIPLWNPYYYCGHPFLANPSNFVFYPSTLLYILLPLPWAFNLDTIIHFILAALGAYSYVHLVTRSREAALVSAVVFSLSGYFTGRLFAGHITLLHAASLVPWVFLCVEKYFLSGRVSVLVVTGLVLGLQILGGDPQISYYTSFFLALYFLARIISLKNDEETRMPLSLVRVGLSFLIIPLVAFGLAAVQIIPSYELMSLSERANNTYEFATSYSFPCRNFFTFLVPYPRGAIELSWEYGCYAGILPLFLIAIGILFSKNRKSLAIFGFMTLAAVSFILGHYTPIYKLYYASLPLLSTFRVPARCLVICVFCVAVMAGLGAQALLERPDRRRLSYLGLVIFGVLLGSLFCGAIFFDVKINSKEISWAIIFLFSSLAVVSLAHVIKNNTAMMAIILSCLFLDFFILSSETMPTLEMDDLDRKQQFESVFEQDPGLYRVSVPGFGDVFSPLYGLPARGMKHHYYGINGNTPIIVKSYFDFVYSMAGIPKPDYGRHTFIRELFQPQRAFSSRILGVKYAIVETPSGFHLLTAQDYQPKAILANEAFFTLDEQEHLSYMLENDFNPKKTVLLQDKDRQAVSRWLS